MSRQIIRIAFAIVLSMLVSLSADAQLNLKNIANKAAGQLKNAVEEKAGKAADSAKETAKEAATQTATQAAAPIVEAVAEEEENEFDDNRIFSLAGYNPARIYTPSEETKQAVPQASSDKIWPGFTRTEAQICGAYEHLPESGFLFLPFAQCKDMYYLGPGSANENFCDAWLTVAFQKFMNGYMRGIVDPLFVQIPTLPNGKSGYLPHREIVSLFYNALYAADPYSSVAFSKWANIFMYEWNSLIGYQQKMEDEDHRVIDSKEGKMCAYSLNDLSKFNFERNRLCVNIAINVTPADIIKNFLMERYAKFQEAQEQGNTLEEAKNIYLFNSIYKEVVEDRKDLKDDNDILLAKSRIDKILLRDLRDNYFAEHTDPVDMPAPGHMDAAATNALNAAAKEQFGADRVVKAYFTVSDWHVFKYDTYPYNVRGRSADCVIIVKDNDKYYMYERTLTQGHNGTSFTSEGILQAGEFTGKLPVNYK